MRAQGSPSRAPRTIPQKCAIMGSQAHRMRPELRSSSRFPSAFEFCLWNMFCCRGGNHSGLAAARPSPAKRCLCILRHFVPVNANSSTFLVKAGFKLHLPCKAYKIRLSRSPRMKDRSENLVPNGPAVRAPGAIRASELRLGKSSWQCFQP
jgi:hypothetical protein